MFGLHLGDAIVVIVYLLGITVFGAWMGRRIKATKDFFMPRRFGKGMMMMHAFGTGTASDQAAIVASATAQKGLSGIWFQWLWLFNTPFYWLIAPIFRRLRATTTADVYQLRFGSSVAILFAAVGILGLSVKIGLLLKGAGALIDAGTGGSVPTEIAIPVVAALFLIYGIAGGLSAAIVTDYIQGILTIVFSFILLPSVLGAVGGLQGVRETIADPQMLSLVAPDKIDAFFVVTFATLSLVGIVAQPFIMGVCAAGRTEMDGRFGFVAGNLIKRLCSAAWAVTGIAALAYVIQQGGVVDKEAADQIYGSMAHTFLVPGLLGLFIASLLAGVMSSCDSFMISASGLFTENLYKPLAQGRSERHYMLVGRIISVFIVLSGIGFAFLMPSLIDGLKAWLKIPALLGVAFWIGLFWRRFNSAGAWASFLGGGMVTVWFMVVETELSDPWQIVLSLSVALVAGVVASLVTRAPEPESIGRFHSLIRTPIAEGEVIAEPCHLPEGTDAAERATWFTGTDFEFPRPSTVSWIGFLAAWGAVAIIIVGFVSLFA